VNASPITLAVLGSRRLVAALCAAHALAGFGLPPTELPLAVKLALAAILALSLLIAVRRIGRITALTLHADGRVSLLRRDGRAFDGQVDPATTVFPWLVVLLVKTAEKTEALVLPVDALDRDGHRQLRLWLRWKANAEPV
jgi:toxin CptA